jgi:hypothetical protein
MKAWNYKPTTDVRFDSKTGERSEMLTHWVTDSNDRYIALVVNYGGPGDSTTIKTAKLIESAPELYEALKLLVENKSQDSTLDKIDFEGRAMALIARIERPEP